MDNELLSQSIKRICKDNNMTVSQLEKKLNISAGLISRWSKTSPSLDKIVDIADFFNLSIDEVIGREIKNGLDISTKFINKIYEMTSSKKMKWQYITQHDFLIDFPYFDNIDSYEKEEFFFTKYGNGKLILFARYDILDGAIDCFEVDIYIQADLESRLVVQQLDKNKMEELWVYIHAQSFGELDEVKAEKFKSQFLNETDDNIMLSKSQIDEINKDPLVKEFMKQVDNNAVKELIKIIDNPELQRTLRQISRLSKYQNEFNNK